MLQLTSYIEDGGEKDNVAVLRALQAQIHGKMAAAHEFLNVSPPAGLARAARCARQDVGNDLRRVCSRRAVLREITFEASCHEQLALLLVY